MVIKGTNSCSLDSSGRESQNMRTYFNLAHHHHAFVNLRCKESPSAQQSRKLAPMARKPLYSSMGTFSGRLENFAQLICSIDSAVVLFRPQLYPAHASRHAVR